MVRERDRGLDRDNHCGAHGHSLHFGSTLVPTKQAEAPQASQKAHWFQRLLVLSPSFCHRLWPSHRPRILLVPHQEMVQENGMYTCMHYYPLSLLHMKYFS